MRVVQEGMDGEGQEPEGEGEDSSQAIASLPEGAGNHELMVLLQSLAMRENRDSII